jgi:tRNA A-37 threonylcarbamoyl transferase component Bud32
MADALIGRMIDGRYRLESLLGTGGVGRVYLARHVLIGRRVAIKILHPERRAQSHLRAWFLREARAANRVNHANIVEIHDFGETEDGLAYIVMEYLEGRPLSAEVAKGPIPVESAADTLEQVSAALARAHDLGVVHRDIKPENIFLIDRAGRADFVKLLDFGLAHLAQDSRLAAPGAVFGTPEYMSPEQARGEEATAQSDLYALGVVFYEAVTGQLPFDSHNRDDIPAMHIGKEPAPPRTLNPSLPQEAEEIILKLLAKDLTARYVDAHHVLDDLKSLMLQTSSTSWSVPEPKEQAQVRQVGRPTSTASVWALRGAAFGRMVARAYAGGGAPAQVVDDLEAMWKLIAAVTRLESDVASQVRSIQALERRGREFRGQAGRKIEELSRAESRLRRAATEARLRIEELDRERRKAEAQLSESERAFADAAGKRPSNLDVLRNAAERSGVARSRLEDIAATAERQRADIDHTTSEAARLDGQIHQHRERLAVQTDAFDAQLRSAREVLATRASETQELVRKLDHVAATLSARMRGRPECLTLLDELAMLESPARPLIDAE